MKKISAAFFPLLVGPVTQAALIVNLDPVDARFDSLTDNDDSPAGFAAGLPTAANGLTFNVTFTPVAADLESSTQAINIMEIGGDANGSGLYLLGGELHFLSKMNGTGANFLSGFNDLNLSSGNNLLGVKSGFGTLNAGTEYTVAVLFDPITSASLEIGILPTDGGLSLESFSVSGVGTRTNWHGDNSATAFRGTDVGNLGGTVISSDPNTTYPFHENNINARPFAGTQGQALYWDLPGAVIAVPEPSGTALLLLGTSVAFVRRR